MIIIIQGMGGLMSITGLPDGEPGGGPMRVGVAVVDLFTGLYTLRRDPRRALPARAERARARISTWRLFDTQLAMLANQASQCAGLAATTRRGRAIPTPISCPTSRSTRPISRSSSPSATTASSRGWRRFAGIRNGPATRASRPMARGSPIARRSSALVAAMHRARARRGVARAARGGGHSGRADQPHQPGAGRRPGAASRRWCGRSPACRWSDRRCGSTARAPTATCRRRRSASIPTKC